MDGANSAIAVLRQRVQEAADAITSRLRAVDASPFIGQILILDEEQKLGRIFLRLGDSFQSLCKMLERYPALGLALVAGAVARQDGSSLDELAVFGHIEHLVRRADRSFSQAEKEELSVAFRSACVKLGLTVQRGKRQGDLQWRVREFILQGGARLAHSDRLADAFLRTERSLGTPDPSDTMECVRFSDAAAERLEAVPRLRTILENDQTGWHVSVFARLRRGEEQVDSPVRNALKKEIEKARSRPSSPSERRPELVLRGVDLCVSVPEGGPLTIDDGQRGIVLCGGEAALRVPWPTNLTWQVLDGQPQAFARWLGEPDACAIFDAEMGAFLGSAQPGTSLTVRPGHLAIASRHPFSVGGERAEAFLGGVYLAWVLLTDSDLAVALPGSRSAVLRPRIERRITLGRALIQDTKGTTVFGATTVATVSVPGDIGSNLDAELILRHPSLGPHPVRVPVALDKVGLAAVDIAAFLPAKGSFGRLQVALVLPGQDRSLVSTSAWFWPGLTRFDGAIFHGPVPDDLDEPGCRGVHRDGDMLAVVAGDARAQALLRFSSKALHLMAPGVHAWIERPGADDRTPSPIPPASLIPIGGNLASVLKIACDRPDAILEVGSVSEVAAFTRGGVRRITFASLAEALESQDGEVRVRYRGPSDAPHTVCRLVRAETPIRFGVARLPTAIEIAIESLQPIEVIRFECTDLVEGSTKSTLPDMLNSADGPGRFTGGTTSGRAALHVRLGAADFSDGIWSAQAYCRLAGMTGFRPFQEGTGERYALSFQVRQGVFMERVDPRLLQDAEKTFRRAGAELRIPVAAPIPDTLRLVDNLYVAAGRQLLDADQAAAARAFATDLVTDDTVSESPGYVPAISIFGVDVRAFSAPASAYADLPDSTEFASFAGLAALSRARMLKDAFANPRFEGAIACAFSNAGGAQRVASIDLTDFDFAFLTNVLKICVDDFEDDPPLLGHGFFAGTQRQASVGLAMAHTNPANGTRVGQALFIAKQALHAAGNLAGMAETLAEGTRAYPKGIPYVAPAEREENEAGGLESLFAFLSALALAARLDARGGRYLPSFMEAIQHAISRFEGVVMGADTAAGICAHIAPQYFAAHLLLWELLIRSREPND